LLLAVASERDDCNVAERDSTRETVSM